MCVCVFTSYITPYLTNVKCTTLKGSPHVQQTYVYVNLLIVSIRTTRLNLAANVPSQNVPVLHSSVS